MNKKGFFTDALVDAFAFIAVVLLLVLFSIVFTVIKDSGQFDIKGQELDMDAEAELLQILNTEIEIDGYKADVASQIVFAEGDRKRMQELTSQLGSLFQAMIDQTTLNYIQIAIHYEPPKTSFDRAVIDDSFGALEKIVKDDNKRPGDRSAKARIQLPGHNKTYEVWLFIKNDRE